MAIVTGARTSANTTSTNQAVDIDPILKYIQEYQTPLHQFYMMNKVASKGVKNKKSKFEWHEKSPLTRTTTTTKAITGGATTETGLTISELVFRFGDTLLVESTGDVLQVTNVPTTTTINVRKVGTGNITAAASGIVILNLSPAVKEDYARTTAMTNNMDNKSGYCQIGLDMISMSGREDAGDSYTNGETMSDLLKEKTVEIAKYEERKFLFNGAAYLDETNNISYSAGFRGSVTTNVKYWAGTLDETEIEDILEQVLAKNDGSEVIGYMGNNYAKQLGSLMKDRFTYNTNDYIRAYGGLAKNPGSNRLLKYMSSWGEVMFVWNPMLAVTGGDVYTNSCLFLSRSKTKLRYMENDFYGSRKYRIEPDVQDNGTGAKSDQIMWDTGLEVGPEVYHGWHLKS